MSKIKNRIHQLFESKSSNILSVFFTAGFPGLDDTVTLCQALQKAGTDMLEIGFPFSDPLADGETIQRSSEQALKNGMSLKLLFKQLSNIRETVKIPLLLMGYINPVLQYGMPAFIADCLKCGIDGVIVPDLPLQEFNQLYREQFEKAGLSFISLITPQTSDQRVKQIDSQSDSFIYAVSSAAITGTALAIGEEREKYLQRLKSLQLKNPLVLGFGISDHETFSKACNFVSGAIVGSAYLRALNGSQDLEKTTITFVRSIKGC